MEQGKVKTEVGLGSCFPFQVIIAQLVTLETAGQLLTAIRTSNIIACSITLSAETSFTVIALIECIAGNV